MTFQQESRAIFEYTKLAGPRYDLDPFCELLVEESAKRYRFVRALLEACNFN